MSVQGAELFVWWAASISGGSVFLTLVSIYLYASGRTRQKESEGKTMKAVRLVKNFIFVWVLLGLLVFYIVSVNIGSAAIFAAGNIFVEIILVIYLMKNRPEKPEQARAQD
jgi:hypothetical protein